ncbi:DEAD/DEAH box helicase [Carnobacterium maltaromaticum]|uniref:DEAD/DEAH box helicase n=1 Tax=Carnobacterium maltaromaticum TaxID=2751 RepID=UPI00295F3A95|nr:DEAD/DEAH box helicase [Carnobacterium maltaromaticum]
MDNFIGQLKESLHRGFIDSSATVSEAYKPELLINNREKNETVLATLLNELEHCKTFIFSVAFITESGLASLKAHLLNLKDKGISGRILTSYYLSFNNPKVFKELMKLDNVEVRLTDSPGFHAKGYLFDNGEYSSVIIGSSNLTMNALKVNYEWNIKLTSHENGEIVKSLNQQISTLWEESIELTEEWISKYELMYTPIVNTKKVDQLNYQPNKITYKELAELEEEEECSEYSISDKEYFIKPNKMQKKALKSIAEVRNTGENKALVISATGTGKTYLAAFDVRDFKPKRMLFIVHREQILRKAKSDFQKIIGGPEEDFGILSGNSKDINAKYLFATIDTISKDASLQIFKAEAFDYILIDEVHRAGADSYLNVLNYFSPKFLLGMTATPERNDNFNIYGLFDYNIAYEIRLQEALEEDMLCPFHYFGVTDYLFKGEINADTSVLSKIAPEEHVNHIIEKINYYGFSGNKVRGLIFCSGTTEAKKLSKLLNKRGFRTVSLIGTDKQIYREEKIKELENGRLDYIITVDVFNEGIDIPSINQVIMLRQTKSSIIFIQQLGRGLRKDRSKDFVTIIDFIGNYKTNYLIPIALSGDKSFDKDNIRRDMLDMNYIKGISTINFESIASKRIFESINKRSLTAMKMIDDAFYDLKNRIGRVPYLIDFITNFSIDPLVIIDKHTNYHKFLCRLGKNESSLTEYEEQVLTMISNELLNGKRKHEIILLDELQKNDEITLDKYKKVLEIENCISDEQTIQSSLNVLTLSFFEKVLQAKYGHQPLIKLSRGNFIEFNTKIKNSLKKNDYFRALFNDMLSVAFNKNREYDTKKALTLYKKYSRKDMCRLLNWLKNESGTVNGYKVKDATVPIFINYDKSDEIDSNINYRDKFLDPKTLRWYTRNPKRLGSEEVQKITNAGKNGIEIHIFVAKEKGDGKDYYYLGKAYPNKKTAKEGTMINKGLTVPVVHMDMVMEQTVDRKIYSYLISE